MAAFQYYDSEMLITDLTENLDTYGGPTEAQALEGLECCDPEQEGDDLRLLCERVSIAMHDRKKAIAVLRALLRTQTFPVNHPQRLNAFNSARLLLEGMGVNLTEEPA